MRTLLVLTLLGLIGGADEAEQDHDGQDAHGLTP